MRSIPLRRTHYCKQQSIRKVLRISTFSITAQPKLTNFSRSSYNQRHYPKKTRASVPALRKKNWDWTY
jgi:hypothetical protein